MDAQHLDIEIQVSAVNSGNLLELRNSLVHELQSSGIDIDTNIDEKSIVPPAILVKLLNSDAISSFSSAVFGWLAKDRSRTLKFQIGDKQMEATGLTKTEQQKLIEWFQTQAGLHFNK